MSDPHAPPSDRVGLDRCLHLQQFVSQGKKNPELGEFDDFIVNGKQTCVLGRDITSSFKVAHCQQNSKIQTRKNVVRILQSTEARLQLIAL